MSSPNGTRLCPFCRRPLGKHVLVIKKIFLKQLFSSVIQEMLPKEKSGRQGGFGGGDDDDDDDDDDFEDVEMEDT